MSLFLIILLSFIVLTGILSHLVERHGYNQYKKTYESIKSGELKMVFKRTNYDSVEYYFSNLRPRFDKDFRKVSFLYDIKMKRYMIKLYGVDGDLILYWSFINFFNPYVLYWNIKLWSYFEKIKKY